MDKNIINIIAKDLKGAHFNADAIIQSIQNGTQGNIIYEGNALRIYSFECVFSGFKAWIEFMMHMCTGMNHRRITFLLVY